MIIIKQVFQLSLYTGDSCFWKKPSSFSMMCGAVAGQVSLFYRLLQVFDLEYFKQDYIRANVIDGLCHSLTSLKTQDLR